MNTEILVPIQGHQKEIITTEALGFAALLHKTFNSTRLKLLNDRTVFENIALPLQIEGVKGEIITNKQLIGYVSLERNGELLLYSRIIGHGDHLKNGIMYLLNQEIIRWIIDGESQVTDGIKYIMYAGWNDGTAGLKMWKKRTLFKPYYLQV